MPVGVTKQAETVQSLWNGSWIAALATGVVVWGLILWSVAFHRKKKHSKEELPPQVRYNLPIEILYTVAPVIVVLVLFYFTVVTQNEVLAEATESGPPDHTVTVVGQQWSWTFNYDEDEALDGSTTVYDVGTPADRPTLVLPVNESVDIQLRSPDVIHSFWVPAFLFKLDVVPGRDNHFGFTPTRTGTFVGRCAELCGTYHSRMLFDVRIVSAEEYASHLRRLQQLGNVGQNLGGSEVNQQNGLQNEVQDNDQSTGASE
jgi:cytochrome c oxidase subunit II